MTDLSSRREFLTWSAAAGAAAFALPSALVASSRRAPQISVQLYSVRDDCHKDFDAALKSIAEMGFDGVEFAGYHKYSGDAAGLRKKLDELNLKAAATHIGAGSFVA